MHVNTTLHDETIRVSNAVAAGTTNVNTTVVDSEGCEALVWTALFGALTATQVTGMKIQGGNLSDGTDAADLVGAVNTNLGDADSNKCLIIEVKPDPAYRYYRAVVTRGTANAVIDGVLCRRVSIRKAPLSQGATIDDAMVAIQPKVSNAAFTQTTTTFGTTTTRISKTERTTS